MDLSQLQFTCSGLYRHSDGSFKFMLVVLNPSQVVGAPPEITATTECHVKNAAACLALAGALSEMAKQIPADIVRTA